MTKIRNIKGTANNRCKCGSWINHWEKYSQTKSTICAEIKCKNKIVLGAHIQKVNSESREWFIIPLCSAHNNSAETLCIKQTIFVPANITITCSNN